MSILIPDKTVVQKQTTRKFAGKNKHATQNGGPKSHENLMKKWLWRSCEISLSLYVLVQKRSCREVWRIFPLVHQVTSVPQGLARRGEAARLRSPQWGGRPGLGPLESGGMGSDVRYIKVGFCWVYTCLCLLNGTKKWSKLGSVGSWPSVLSAPSGP